MYLRSLPASFILDLQSNVCLVPFCALRVTRRRGEPHGDSRDEVDDKAHPPVPNSLRL